MGPAPTMTFSASAMAVVEAEPAETMRSAPAILHWLTP